MIKKILLWIAVVLMSLQIFGFSSKTAAESSGTSEKIALSVIKLVESIIEIDEEHTEQAFYITHLVIRKSAHFAEFGLLSVLTFFLARSYGLKLKTSVIISLGYCLFFAATDEFHQLFVSGRSGRFWDILIDFSGGIFANICIIVSIKIKKRLFDKK